MKRSGRSSQHAVGERPARRSQGVRDCGKTSSEPFATQQGRVRLSEKAPGRGRSRPLAVAAGITSLLAAKHCYSAASGRLNSSRSGGSQCRAPLGRTGSNVRLHKMCKVVHNGDVEALRLERGGRGSEACLEGDDLARLGLFTAQRVQLSHLLQGRAGRKSHRVTEETERCEGQEAQLINDTVPDANGFHNKAFNTSTGLRSVRRT